jgi:hypothetical protein
MNFQINTTVDIKLSYTPCYKYVKITDMKRYEKRKFWFLWDNGTKKEPKNGESYFRYKWKLKPKFPFLFRVIVCYILIDDIWVEQPE